MNEPQLTPSSIRFPNDAAPPEGYCAPGRSLITEIERLREAVLMLCEMQKELTKKVDVVANRHITKEAAP